MSSTVKEISKNKHEVTVEVDVKVWLDAQKKEKEKALKEVKVDGFRKGHVPANLAEKYVNTEKVLGNAINNIIPVVLGDIYKEHKLYPIIQPKVNVDKVTLNELTLRFIIVTSPVATLGQYKDLGIKKDEINVADEDVSNEIANLLKDNAELVITDKPAKNGDTIIFDFEGFVDGSPFDGGTAKNYELVLGSGKFIPGFEDQLIGVKANEEKDVNVTFPENYVENLKGKPATFKCKIHEVKEKVIPELNDETAKDLAKTLKIENINTVEDLKNHERDVVTKRKEAQRDSKYYSDVVNKIVENASVEIDDEIVNEEANAIKENNVRNVEQQGFKWEQYLQIIGKKDEEIFEQFKKDALNRLKVSFVFNALCKENNITVTNEEIEAQYKELADMYKMKVEDLKKAYAQYHESLVNQLYDKKIRDFILSVNK